MSHHGAHNWTAWSTEVVTNAAGESQPGYVRYCTIPRCGAVDRERGAIIESPQEFRYALRQEEQSEPDD